MITKTYPKYRASSVKSVSNSRVSFPLRIALAIASFACAFTASATVIDFSPSEGYTANESLSGQQDWIGSSAWTVTDSSTAYIDIATDGAGAIFYGGTTVNPNDGISLQADFSFNYAGIQSANGTNIAQYRLATSTTGDNSVFVSLRLVSGAFRLYYLASNGTSVYSPTFTAASIGLDPGNSDFDSDSLRISVTLLKGDNADDWTLSMTLTNLDNSGSIVMSMLDVTASTAEAFYASSDIYSGMHTGPATASGGLSSWTTSSFEIASVPEPSRGSMLFALGALVLISISRMRSQRSK